MYSHFHIRQIFSLNATYKSVGQILQFFRVFFRITGCNVNIDMEILEMVLLVLSCHVYIYYIRCSATTPKCPPANAHYTSDFLLQNYKVYCTFIFLDIMWNKPTKKK